MHGVVRHLDALIRAGNQMSNICYNLAQKSEYADGAIMRDCYKEWDTAKTAIREQIPK